MVLAPPPAPRAGPGVCALCHGPARQAHPHCWCCDRVAAACGLDPDDLPPVLPVGLCAVGDRWHAVLRGYKAGPVGEARRHHRSLLAGALAAFLGDHGGCLHTLAGDVDGVCVVPSSTPGVPAGFHPLAAVLRSLPAPPADRWGRALPLVPLALVGAVPGGAGAAGPDHLRPAPAALAPPPEGVGGRRLLVVDDVWTTGAHALSAVVSLRAAGATVGAVLVAGRRVPPGATGVPAGSGGTSAGAPCWACPPGRWAGRRLAG